MYISFQRGSRLVLSIYVEWGSTNHELASHQMPTFGLLACSLLLDVCPEEDCSPAVETSAFDDEFVKPIRGW